MRIYALINLCFRFWNLLKLRVVACACHCYQILLKNWEKLFKINKKSDSIVFVLPEPSTLHQPTRGAFNYNRGFRRSDLRFYF